MEMSESLEHPEVYVREAAVQAAATAASASNAPRKLASDIVTRLQQDSDPLVRRIAAEVLGELKHHDAAVEQALTKAAREDEPAVRLAARKSLAVLEAHSSREPANQALETV
jgi:HEAT repeat protein